MLAGFTLNMFCLFSVLRFVNHLLPFVIFPLPKLLEKMFKVGLVNLFI